MQRRGARRRLTELRRHKFSAFAVAVVAVGLCAFDASAAAAAITIPAGDGVVLSGASSQSCNNIGYGYVLGASAPVPVAQHLGGCSTDPLAGATIPISPSARSLVIYIDDYTCNVTFSSDGSGNANHALVDGNNPYTVYLNDGGGGCPYAHSNWAPVPTFASFTVTATVTGPQPPPTVTVSAPSPPAGQSGFFNAHDLAVNGGAIPVNVSARDNSTGGIGSIICTDNGAGTTVTPTSAAGGATTSGIVKVSANGAHTVACSAADRLGDSGNSGGANSATLSIDSTAPVVSVPASPVLVQGSASGASLSTYNVSATDADPRDQPVIKCTPAAPAQFPVGDSRVTCQATDRAGNVGTGQFVVRVLAPASMSIAAVASSGAIDRVTLACAGAQGQFCAGTLTATANATTATVAAASVDVAAGQSTTATLALNGAGQRLLRRSYHMSTTLSFGGIVLDSSLSFAYRLVSPRPDSSWATWTWANQPCGFCYTEVDSAFFFGVPKLLVDARVRLVCTGAGCPPPRSFGPGRRSVNLKLMFSGRKFGPGTVIKLRITAPNSVGRLVTYTTRAGTVPERTVQCLPPGAPKPVACAAAQ